MELIFTEKPTVNIEETSDGLFKCTIEGNLYKPEKITITAEAEDTTATTSKDTGVFDNNANKIHKMFMNGKEHQFTENTTTETTTVRKASGDRPSGPRGRGGPGRP